MDKFIIVGGNKLNGEIEVESSKNAYLPILSACLLCEEEVVLKKCPIFEDIKNMCDILKSLGVKVEKFGDELHINAKYANNFFISQSLSKKLRSSIFTLGSLLGRFKQAKVAYPGGCEIGLRPVDLHLKGLRALGVKTKECHGYINCDGSGLKGSNICLDFPSVGATENLIMAAVLAKGVTTIFNPAKEPEIEDLQNFLNKMGAKVCGAGTNTITIVGVKKLNGCHYTPIPDRIVAGTYLIASAMCGGKLLIKNVISNHFSILINKLQNSGCKIKQFNDKIYIESSGRLKSINFIKTMPYPGFPTDLQSQILCMQTISKGYSLIQENLFETRFKFVPELLKMGANITIKNQTAYVLGVKKLFGAEVYAKDLRGGAALVLAGLCAEGYTTVYDVYHIDRGYENLEKKLSLLGADIKREREQKWQEK